MILLLFLLLVQCFSCHHAFLFKKFIKNKGPLVPTQPQQIPFSSSLPLSQPPSLSPERSYKMGSSIGNAIRYNELSSLPPVEVQIVVASINKINEEQNSFDIDFVMNLHWIDPLVSDDIRHIDALSFYHPSNYYDPVVVLENSWVQGTSSGLPEPLGGMETNRINYIRGSDGHLTNVTVTRSEHYRVTLNCDLNLLDFPFDNASLPLFIKTLPVESCAALNWNSKNVPLHDSKNHELTSGSDRLSEWVLGGITSEQIHENELHVGIKVVRESDAGFWSDFFPLFSVASFSFCIYAQPYTDVSGRICNDISLTLTAVLFKYVVESRLPPQPFLTVLDRYLVSVTLILLYQALGHALLGLVTNPTQFHDYFTTTLPEGLTFKIDSFFLTTSTAWFFVLQVWLYTKFNKAAQLKDQYMNEYDNL